jgi:hypothetical protein
MPEDDWNICHFCGEDVKDGIGASDGKRHWLSDCRPDLVEHEIGPICTWSYTDKYPNCYAYQDLATREWTDQHTHFYKDGPM